VLPDGRLTSIQPPTADVEIETVVSE